MINFPNSEVKDAFLASLVKVCTDKDIQTVYNLNDKFYESIVNKDEENYLK